MLTTVFAERYGGEYLAISFDDIIHPKQKANPVDVKSEAKNRLESMGIEVK